MIGTRLLIGTIIGALILIGSFVYFKEDHIGAMTESKFIQSVSTAQNSYLSQGKYKYIPKTTANGYTYSVTEYVTPNNEKGYQIILYYPDKVKSIGYGVEASSRTYEIIYPIQEVQNDTASSTTE